MSRNLLNGSEVNEHSFAFVPSTSSGLFLSFAKSEKFYKVKFTLRQSPLKYNTAHLESSLQDNAQLHCSTAMHTAWQTATQYYSA